MFILVLGIEEEIYTSDSATLAIQIIELLFLTIFVFDRIVDCFMTKNNYQGIYYSLILIPIIMVLFIWTILDMADKDEFRELGAFRFLRVILIVLKFDETRYALQPYLDHFFDKVHSNVQNFASGNFKQCPECKNKIKTFTTNIRDSNKKINSGEEF